MSSLQTARVTKKGKVGFALGIGGFVNDKNDDDLFAGFAFYE